MSILKFHGQGGVLIAVLIGCLMIALAVAGVVASIQARGLLLAVVAVVSFVPMGFYMFGSPGVWKWIGISEIVMLLAAVIMGLTRYSGDGGPG